MLDPPRDFPPVRHGYRTGYRKGKAEGEAKGEAKGEARGRMVGKSESVLTVLEARGVRVTPSLRQKILSCTDADRLERWLRSAASAASAAEVVAVR